MYATIYRADSPLARCMRCGTQKQYHVAPRGCGDFTAETAADIEPADLRMEDLIRHINYSAMRYDTISSGHNVSTEEWREADRHVARRDACRVELEARVKAVFSISFDDLGATLGKVVMP